MKNIVENKRVKEALAKGEEHFRKIFTYSNDAIFVIDPAKDEIIDVNPRATDMLGYSREELLSLPITSIHPNEMPELLAFAQSVFDKGSGWTNELTCLTKSGKTLPAEISASVIDISGTSYMIALVRDISERKRMEEALRESENRLSRILQSAMDAIITVNNKLEITLFNEAAENVFRFPASEAIGQLFDRFLSEKFRAMLSGYIRSSSKSGGANRYMWIPEGLTAIRSGGGEFPIEATVSQVDVGGQKLYTVILRDVNERKKAEEKLQKLQLENVYLQEDIKAGFGEIVGKSQAIKKVFQNIERVAGTDATVLLTGETGTGKELFARAIHNLSSRKESVLVTVNCAALPSGLIESELFGHEKGAFTGALSLKIGRFELASGGTILLDEIGDLSLELQAKLLRVLQEGEFERVGGSETLKVDVRVIAATNQNLEKAMEVERFRQDLFYRLNVFPIQIPSLRERKGDIPLLVRYFAMKYGKKLGKEINTIPQKTMEALKAYPWPGNVRELENIIERAIILSRESQLELGDWLPKPGVTPRGSRIQTLEELDRKHIMEILELAGWRVSGERGAAKILGLKTTT
ncbi:sigma 54-interacting transcriptional regulator, partial [candidate division TA06 bacterium]|nr:sigma 54-interacting transcriptional regulator [candidate division TA06 bacterium]